MSRMQGRCTICKKFESAGDIIRGYHKCPPAFLVIMSDEKPQALEDFTKIYADDAEEAAEKYVQNWYEGESVPDDKNHVFVYSETTGERQVFSVTAEIVVQYNAANARGIDAPEFPKFED